MLNWDLSKEDFDLVREIALRAVTLSPELSRFSLEMDITATHLNGNPMDLDKLLDFDDENFMHDICGILNHINRKDGKLLDCFSPRCSV